MAVKKTAKKVVKKATRKTAKKGVVMVGRNSIVAKAPASRAGSTSRCARPKEEEFQAAFDECWIALNDEFKKRQVQMDPSARSWWRRHYRQTFHHAVFQQDRCWAGKDRENVLGKIPELVDAAIIEMRKDDNIVKDRHASKASELTDCPLSARPHVLELWCSSALTAKSQRPRPRR